MCQFATESEDNDSSLGKNLSDLSQIIMSIFYCSDTRGLSLINILLTDCLLLANTVGKCM